MSLIEEVSVVGRNVERTYGDSWMGCLGGKSLPVRCSVVCVVALVLFPIVFEHDTSGQAGIKSKSKESRSREPTAR